jgi:peptidoglycan/LPS O-acetylase OafA/YrhL
LRAAAVIPVVLFHADVPGNSGGFLGVDIFFVISGFLITSILVREAEEGRFSIVAFYYRRVRRIFPALFVLLFAATAAALFLLSPKDLVLYGHSLVATTVFASNVFFFRETGYFDTSSLEKPLLHTWSLAVEEQFYLVWPLLLSAVLKYGGRRLLVIVVLAGTAISFVTAVAGSYWDAVATFYLPFTRAWELGLGAALAILPSVACPQWLREAGGLAGLLLIFAAITLMSDETPLFLASGVACIGTALLIALNRERTLASRFLSLAPFVAIGLISYSLYLWHWPLLAFGRYFYVGQPPALVRTLLILVAVGLAFLSWFLVEQPLRRPGSRRKAFAMSATAMAMLVFSGLTLAALRGLPNRFGPDALNIERIANRRPKFCFGCGTGRTVLWGDSHAAALSPAIPAITFTSRGCPPLSGAAPSADCARFEDRALKAIRQLNNVDEIVLAGRWAMATETTRLGGESGPRYFLGDSTSHERSVANSRRAFLSALPRTVRLLEQAQPKARIILIGQAPEPGFDVAQCVLRARMFRRSSDDCELASPDSLSRLQLSDQLIETVAARDPRVAAIFLDRRLCSGNRCRTTVNSLPLYSDFDHLTPDAAKALIRGTGI